ncbi:hypothetical protein BB560_004946 [Smittium megazygosporum]|uniref:Importin N-terminal domain-containing protein n=1 Tax=Smittium megazygosporum TaxID=133381 RepID=A0A2T9Z7T2_9FUNG|nr:hypothetical protein BB560_004946 [Smittium megazygosporum]
MDQEFVSNLQTQLREFVFATSSEKINSITNILSTQFYIHVNCIPALVEISSSAPESQVRQLAAVELRKRIIKFWEQVDEQTKTSIRAHLINQIQVETDSLTRNALARVISKIGQIDLPLNTWPDLLEFLYNGCLSQNVALRETCVLVLDSLLEATPEALSSHFAKLLELFSKLVADPESIKVRVSTVEAMGKIGEWIEIDNKSDIQYFQNLVPSMAQVLEVCLASADEDNASRCFDVFNTLILLEAPLLNKHLGELVNFSLAVGSNKELDENLRIMALNLLVWTASYKRSKLIKLKVVPTLIKSLMLIATEPDPEDVDDDSPSRVSLRVLNTLSTNLPPSHVFPVVAENVLLFVQNEDPLVRKGGMMTLAIIVEGSVDFVRDKVGDLIQLVVNGLSDPDKRVQKASCLALGCIADELSDEIAIYHEKLIPQILGILASSENPENTKYACNALDVILEGLGQKINPYLQHIMSQLVVLLENGPPSAKPMVLASIGSAAFAAGEQFLPYFKEIVPKIGYMMSLNDSDDSINLRGVATDTMGTIAQAVGPNEFRPYLEDSMKLAFEGMAMDRSNLRECGFCFFGIVCSVFQEEFTKYLPIIVPEILKTLQTPEKLMFDDILDDQEDEDEGSGPTISTAISEEKEIAANCAAEIFTFTRSGFLPYVTEIVTEIVKLLSHYSENVRKAAISSLFSFLSVFSSMSASEPWQPGLPVKVPVHENVLSLIKLVLPAVLEVWDEEDDIGVVTRLLVELKNIMGIVGPAVVDGYLPRIYENLELLFKKEALCQLPEVDDGGDQLDSDELAEYDSLLISAAGDCLSELSSILSQDFIPQFNAFFPLLLSFYKPTCALSERSMSIGCLSEITKNLGTGIQPYAESIYQVLISGLSDPEAEVKSNSAFGLGVLVQNVNIDWTPQLPTMLTALSGLFQLTTNPSNVLDNACGSLAKLILKLKEAIPYSEVLPTWLSNLPLKSDHEEDQAVYEAIVFLLESSPQISQQFSAAFKTVIHNALDDPITTITDDVRTKLTNFSNQ